MNFLFGAEISCLLSVSQRVRIIEVIFTKNVWAFSRDQVNCPYQRGVHIREVSAPRSSTVTSTSLFISLPSKWVRGAALLAGYSRVGAHCTKYFFIYLPNARFWKQLYQKCVNQRTSRRASGERQEVEREIRQQGRKFINLKKLTLPYLFSHRPILVISRDPKLAETIYYKTFSYCETLQF